MQIQVTIKSVKEIRKATATHLADRAIARLYRSGLDKERFIIEGYDVICKKN